MILAKVLNSIYKKDGIILEDSTGQKYIIGNPKKKIYNFKTIEK